MGVERRVCVSKSVGKTFFFRLSHTSDKNVLSSGCPARRQASGSALGMVGPVSAYCGWVR